MAWRMPNEIFWQSSLWFPLSNLYYRCFAFHLLQTYTELRWPRMGIYAFMPVYQFLLSVSASNYDGHNAAGEKREPKVTSLTLLTTGNIHLLDGNCGTAWAPEGFWFSGTCYNNMSVFWNKFFKSKFIMMTLKKRLKKYH